MAPVALLRNAEVTSLSPLTPGLDTIFPLDPGVPPAGDRYVDGFVSGDLDPEAIVVEDRVRPLVFYGLDSDDTLKAVKTSAAEIRIVF